MSDQERLKQVIEAAARAHAAEGTHDAPKPPPTPAPQPTGKPAPPRHPVRTEPTVNGKPIVKDAQGSPWAWRAIGLIALVAGLSLWLVGARYTVLGMPRVVAFFFALFNVSVRLVLPIGWAFLGMTIATGAVISAAEFGAYPRRAFFAASLVGGVIVTAIWLLANGIDLASTYQGVNVVADDATDAGRWVASTRWAAVLWTVFLTYAPELFILGGARWLWRGRF